MHADLEQGLLIIEDLGDEGVVMGNPPAPIAERYETAVDVLLHLHDKVLPDVLPVAPHLDHRIPAYDLGALMIEAELLLDWYLPRLGVMVTDKARVEFCALWREACSRRSTRRRPGCCATTILPTCCGCRAAAPSSGSACSISRMR